MQEKSPPCCAITLRLTQMIAASLLTSSFGGSLQWCSRVSVASPSDSCTTGPTAQCLGFGCDIVQALQCLWIPRTWHLGHSGVPRAAQQVILSGPYGTGDQTGVSCMQCMCLSPSPVLQLLYHSYSWLLLGSHLAFCPALFHHPFPSLPAPQLLFFRSWWNKSLAQPLLLLPP